MTYSRKFVLALWIAASLGFLMGAAWTAAMTERDRQDRLAQGDDYEG